MVSTCLEWYYSKFHPGEFASMQVKTDRMGKGYIEKCVSQKKN